MIRMVVFLGNKGSQYKKTRHNIGWMFEDFLNENITPTSKFKSLYYKTDSGVIYLLPQTMMNLSGEAVVKAMQFFKISINEVLIVYDDLETTFGSFKVKKGGGLGGHNGLKSIKEKTGSSDFHRLSLGISRPLRGSVSSYVLGRFNPQEESELELFFSGVKSYYLDYIENRDKTNGKQIKILQQIKD